MKSPPEDNPYLRKPDNPNYLRRAFHHDYYRSARYMITLSKSPEIPRFCNIHGEDPAGARVELTRTGEFFEEALAIFLNKYSQIDIPAYIVMPDHIHLCMNVRYPLPTGLSRAVAILKGKTSTLRYLALPERFKINGVQPVFARGFNDRIAYSSQQWERQIAYTTDNPRRYLVKKQCPDYLLRRWDITINGSAYTAIGNIFLLHAPHLFAVKYHRAFALREAELFTLQSKMLVDNGSVPISPFIHPKEKEIRDYAIETGFPYIRICENGLLRRQYPQGKEFQLISAGRMLLISPAEHDSQHIDMKYTYAKKLNVLAADIARLCNAGIKFI